MKLTIGCTTRPFSALTFAEACEHIADAGYTDVAVYSNAGQIPVRSDSTAEEVAAARKAADDAGVIPSLLISGPKLDLGVDAAVDDYKKLIDNAAELGAKWLLNGGTGREYYLLCAYFTKVY